MRLQTAYILNEKKVDYNASKATYKENDKYKASKATLEKSDPNHNA